MKKRLDYGCLLAFGQGKDDECLLLVYTCGGILTTGNARDGAAGEEERESGGLAQAAGGFEQEFGVAGSQLARIGK